MPSSRSPSSSLAHQGSDRDSARPSHKEIALCAHEFWIQHGCPADLDRAIWLDAEAYLRAGGTRPSNDYRELSHRR